MSYKLLLFLRTYYCVERPDFNDIKNKLRIAGF